MSDVSESRVLQERGGPNEYVNDTGHDVTNFDESNNCT